MINIFVIGTILTTITIGVAYLNYKIANSEEFKIFNEIPMENNNNLLYCEKW